MNLAEEIIPHPFYQNYNFFVLSLAPVTYSSCCRHLIWSIYNGVCHERPGMEDYCMLLASDLAYFTSNIFAVLWKVWHTVGYLFININQKNVKLWPRHSLVCCGAASDEFICSFILKLQQKVMKRDISNGCMLITRKRCVNPEAEKLNTVNMKGSILLISLMKLEQENFPNLDVALLQIHILYCSGFKIVLFNHPV